jgi:hypothetical protein
MDFIDEIKQLSKRIESLKDKITTEEATKTSFIMPLFQLLGYDVFNPHEFLPEFTADVGIKKGEKVDYAIMIDEKPVILVEAKWCGESLDKHDSQLFRYFSTTPAKFAILTNGIEYKFFTDLDEQNKMDTKSFLEFNILDIKEIYINELKKFQKENFNIETIFNTASELKYTNEIIKLLTSQMKSPNDSFVKYILSEIYSGTKTQNVIEKFREIVKKSLNQFVNELMNEKITSALKTNNDTNTEDEVELVEKNTELKISKINTTEEELECYFIVKQIFHEVIPKERIVYKDTESYFAILLDNSSWKWICRFKVDEFKKILYIPNDQKNPIKYCLNSIENIYDYKEELLIVLHRYLKDKE